MRIAFIVSRFPSLSQTFILNQITGLLDRGHEVDIYPYLADDTSKMHPDVETYKLLDRTYYIPQCPENLFWRLLKGMGLLYTHYRKDPLLVRRSLNVFKYGKRAASLWLLYIAIPILNKEPYDIIHCHFAWSGWRGVQFRDVSNPQAKILMSFYGRDVTAEPKILNKSLDSQVLEEVDLYTALTYFLMDKALELGCPKDKIIKFPIGVNLSRFTFKERTLSPDEPVKILTVARLVEKKGIEYSIKAIAKVIKTHQNILYRIVGDGYLRESLENLIKELGISDQVKLLGSKTQTEVIELYDDSHIFVLSSVTDSEGDQEGQGLVLQEAQSMGLPVVSTLHNGIPESVLDGKSAFLVPERDVDALAEKLGYLIEHPEVWPGMGQAGRAYVEKYFDLDKLNDELVQIYQQLLNSEVGEQPLCEQSVIPTSG